MISSHRLLLFLVVVLCSCSGLRSGAPAASKLSPGRMIVHETSFPGGWYRAGGHEAPGRYAPGRLRLGQLDSSAAEFRHPSYDHIASQEVYCFSRHRASEYAFGVVTGREQLAYGRDLVWNEPPGVALSETTARQSTVACTDYKDLLYGGRTPFCRAASQYGLCVSVFEAWVDPVHMSYEDVHALLAEIDRKAAAEVARAGLDG
jgi:hypothetical protein